MCILLLLVFGLRAGTAREKDRKKGVAGSRMAVITGVSTVLAPAVI